MVAIFTSCSFRLFYVILWDFVCVCHCVSVFLYSWRLVFVCIPGVHMRILEVGNAADWVGFQYPHAQNKETKIKKENPVTISSLYRVLSLTRAALSQVLQTSTLFKFLYPYIISLCCLIMQLQLFRRRQIMKSVNLAPCTSFQQQQKWLLRPGCFFVVVVVVIETVRIDFYRRYSFASLTVTHVCWLCIVVYTWMIKKKKRDLISVAGHYREV